MSAIASFIKFPIDAVEELRNDYDQCVQDQGVEVADYGWSGYVLGTLLSYLQDNDIDLMESPYGALASDLCETRGASVSFFTPAHKAAYLAKLSPAQFSSEELRDYFNEFNACNEPEIGEAMLDGIDSIQKSLASLDEKSVILFTIG